MNWRRAGSAVAVALLGLLVFGCSMRRPPPPVPWPAGFDWPAAIEILRSRAEQAVLADGALRLKVKYRGRRFGARGVVVIEAGGRLYIETSGRLQFVLASDGLELRVLLPEPRQWLRAPATAASIEALVELPLAPAELGALIAGVGVTPALLADARPGARGRLQVPGGWVEIEPASARVVRGSLNGLVFELDHDERKARLVASEQELELEARWPLRRSSEPRPSALYRPEPPASFEELVFELLERPILAADGFGHVIARAFAKLNLSLSVGRRRPDGFHELATLFQSIALCDELEIEPADDLTLRVEGEAPSGADNLVLRAASALRSATGTGTGAAIRLRKRIPTGGGLGGGSSDAATTLVALDRLWRTRAKRETLARIALELGSDVPYFLTGGTALGRGRGERLMAVASLPRHYVTLALPDFGLSTAAVFAAHAAGAAADRPTEPVPGDGLGGSTFEPAGGVWSGAMLGSLANHLEGAALDIRPELGRLLEILRDSGAAMARMSGSGSTCFGLFAGLGEATAAVEALAAEGVRGLVTETIDRPTFERLRLVA